MVYIPWGFHLYNRVEGYGVFRVEYIRGWNFDNIGVVRCMGVKFMQRHGTIFVCYATLRHVSGTTESSAKRLRRKTPFPSLTEKPKLFDDR